MSEQRPSISRRELLLAGATAVTLPSWASPDYPSKPITLVIGYPPGGSTDLVGRIIGAELGRQLGQSTVVENLGGAAGTLAANKVAAAAADGYTLLSASNNEVSINPLINDKLRYNPSKDFVPLGLVGTQPLVLVAHPRMGVSTAEEFVKLVKSKPGKFAYGSSGVGSALHLAGEMIKESAGLFMVHIPYRGVAPLTNDLVGGTLDFGIFVLSSGLPHIRSGKVVALGITERKRSMVAPDIPCLSEYAPLSKVEMSAWFGLFGPAQLPAPVVQKLRAAFKATMQNPETRRKLQEAGVTLAAVDASLSAHMQAETEKIKRIVAWANIKE